jgi:hypothetical protein
MRSHARIIYALIARRSEITSRIYARGTQTRTPLAAGGKVTQRPVAGRNWVARLSTGMVPAETIRLISMMIGSLALMVRPVAEVAPGLLSAKTEAAIDWTDTSLKPTFLTYHCLGKRGLNAKQRVRLPLT